MLLKSLGPGLSLEIGKSAQNFFAGTVCNAGRTYGYRMSLQYGLVDTITH